MTNRVLAIAILSFAVFSVGCKSNDTEQFKKDLGQMVPDTSAQKREAITLVNRAYEVYHDNDRSEEERVREAARLLENAIQLDPGFATAHLNLGVLHLEQNNLPAAVALLERAKVLMPSDSRPSYHLGVTFYRMGRAKLAIDEFLKAVRIDDSDQRAVRGLTLACRSVHYADDTTLEVLERSELNEPDAEWRHIIDREIIRQKRQLEVK